MSEVAFQEVVDDPHLKKQYFDPILNDTRYKVPQWRSKLKDLLKIKVNLVASIDSPEAFKDMVRIMAELQTYRDNSSLMLFHLKSLIFEYEKKKKLASNYLERKYYEFFSSLKDSLRKQTFSIALSPLEEKVEELEHLKDLASLVNKRLDDINWSVKTSGDMVTEYFSNCKALRSFDQQNL